MSTLTLPEIIFKLNENVFALSTECVEGIIKNDNSAVGSGFGGNRSCVSGMANIRGQITPLVCLRKVFGFKTATEEVDGFISTLDTYLGHHKNWVNELKNSIYNDTEFKLTNDPHKCAFGQWFDNYKTDSILLSNLLADVGIVHEFIHGLADRVLQHRKDGNADYAKELVEMAEENELVQLISLFGQIKKSYREAMKQFIIVINYGDDRYGLLVDEIISVEKITAVELNHEQSMMAENVLFAKIVDGIAKRSNSESLILTVSLDRLVAELTGQQEVLSVE